MRPPAGEPCFLVSGHAAGPDLVAWAAEHPALLGDGFETLAARIPLPDGGEIPLLGVDATGALSVVDLLEEETRTFYRMGRAVSFLRSRAAWLRRAFPERDLDPERAIHLVVLGEEFSASFVDAMAGLAVSGLLLMRIRDLESSDGRRMLLVEREESRMKSFGGFTAEEEAFFGRLERQRESLRSREEAG